MNNNKPMELLDKNTMMLVAENKPDGRELMYAPLWAVQKFFRLHDQAIRRISMEIPVNVDGKVKLFNTTHGDIVVSVVKIEVKRS